MAEKHYSVSVCESVAKHEHDRFHASAAHVIRHLRDTADQMERISEDANNLPFQHGDVASRMLHTLTWGTANSNVDGLIRAAYEADKASHELAAAMLREEKKI